MRKGTENSPCPSGCERKRSITFSWATRPASGFHSLPRIGELQDTLLDMSLKSQDSEILDESEWNVHR